MTQAGFETRTLRLAGLRRHLQAPTGDPFLRQLRAGTRYADFAAFCAAHLRPDDVMLDVGANIGVTTLVAAATLREGRIVAVEPSPRNGAAFLRNMEANGLEAVTLVQAAVGETAGVASFHDASAYGFVLTGESPLPPHNMPEVPTLTVDEIVRRHAPERLDFIKLDIEGFEWRALRGASETLARFAPLIFLEFNSYCQLAFYNQNPRAFLEYLLDTFPQVCLRKPGALLNVRELGILGFLQANLIEGRGLSDLVCAFGDRDLSRPEGARSRWIGR